MTALAERHDDDLLVAPQSDLVVPVLSRMRSYTHLVDVGHIYFALAVAVAAQVEAGERLWGMLVGGPSGGKTEVIRALDLVADEVAGELTAPGLLSWRGAKSQQQVGLLARLNGRAAFAMIRDLSPLLANSDRGAGGQRDQVYAMLRDAYDGRVQRDLGNVPVPLVYEGQLTLLAAATQVVDQYAAHAGALGDRWVYYRLPTLRGEDARAVARAAYNADPTEARESVQLAALAAIDTARERLDDVSALGAPEERIIDLAVLATRARSAVPRESGYRREILGEVVYEGPARLTHQLKLLHTSLQALGLDAYKALGIVQRVALDSIAPATRRNILAALADGEEITVSELARRCGNHRHPVRRAAEDLEALGLTRGRRDGDPDDPKATSYWRLGGEQATLAARLLRSDQQVARNVGSPLVDGGEVWSSPTSCATPGSETTKTADATQQAPAVRAAALATREIGAAVIELATGIAIVPGTRPAATRVVSAAQAHEWLLGDAPPLVARMRVLELLARVPELGPVGARRLLHRHRINGHLQVRAVPFRASQVIVGVLLELHGDSA